MNLVIYKGLLAVALFHLLVAGLACEDGGGRGVSSVALEKCRAGLRAAVRVPAERKTASLTEACRDLVPPGPCQRTLDDLDSLPPDQKSARLATACQALACEGLKAPRPALCTTDSASLDPARYSGAVQEVQLAWIRQRICPRWEAGKAPRLCSLEELPASAAVRARLMQAFFEADPDVKPDEFLPVAVLPMLLVAHAVIQVRAPMSPSDQQRAEDAKQAVLQDEKLQRKIWDTSRRASEGAYARTKQIEAELKSLTPQQRIQRLVSLMRDGDVGERVFAWSRLGISGLAAVPALVPLLDPKEPLTLRKDAARALGNLRAAACPARSGLERLTAEPDERARRVANEALAKIGPCDPMPLHDK